jgi:hypothetical protein
MAGVVGQNPVFTFLDDTGAPLSSGFVDVYLSGTTTRTNTWQNEGLSILNQNPVELDAAGRATMWLNAAITYKFVVKSAALAEQYTIDPVSGAAIDSGGLTFTHSGTGGVERTLQDKLEEGFVSLADFGADNTGSVDCATPLSRARTVQGSTRILLVPEGSYLASGTAYDVDGDFLWIDKGFTASAVNAMASAENQAVLVTFQTPTDAVIDAKKSRVGISVTGWAFGGQHASGVRSNVFNSSTDGNGNTAFYGHMQTDVDALGSFVLHGEMRHGGGTTSSLNLECSSHTALGSFYGGVINNTSASLNAAGTTNVITGALPVSHPSATALFFTGTNNTNAMGGWVRGIHFHANSMRSAGNTILIEAEGGVDTHLRTVAAAPASTADIWLGGNSAIGLLLTGTYSTAAIRLSAGASIAWEETNAIKSKYDSGSLSIQFLSGANNRVSLDVSATPCLRINATQVVGTRKTGWATMTGTPTRTAFDTATVTLPQLAERVKALIDDLHATAGHGLLGT